MQRRTLARAACLAAIALTAPTLPSCGGGGGGGTMPPAITAAFTESATTHAANGVKILGGSASGSRITLQVAVFGPTTSTDIFSWSFDILIADPTVARYVAGSIQEGNSLTACPGQTIEALAAQTIAQDGKTHVVVGVSKLGACNGNGVAAGQATVATLSFDVLKAGTTALSFATTPEPPVAADSSDATIGSITFDAAAATLAGQ